MRYFSRAAMVNSMNHPQVGNSKLISAVNCRLVLQAMRVTQPTYRAALARKTGVKPATITSIVNDLIKLKMCREIRAPKAVVGSGRPPSMLELNRDAKRLLAIDLEPDRLRVGLTDLLLNIVDYRECLIDRFSSPHTVCTKILELCRQIRRGIDDSRIHGAGVSLPGQIDTDNGILISSTNMPGWRDVPIRRILGRGLGLDVHIERSFHLAALYERWVNPHLQNKTVIVLSLRTGIGLSVLHRGELYTGNLGSDGEIGHTVVALDGPPCECGNRGCLETFVSSSAICKQAMAQMAIGRCRELSTALPKGARLSPELIYGLAQSDEDCARLVKNVGRYLGIASTNMINVLAPHELVVCGSITEAGEIVLDAIEEEIGRSTLRRCREQLNVRLATEREKVPLLGAAVLAARDLFYLPKLYPARRCDGAERNIELLTTPSGSHHGRKTNRRPKLKGAIRRSISSNFTSLRGEYYA